MDDSGWIAWAMVASIPVCHAAYELRQRLKRGRLRGRATRMPAQLPRLRPCPECGRPFDDRGEPLREVCSVYCQAARARERAEQPPPPNSPGATSLPPPNSPRPRAVKVPPRLTGAKPRR